MENVLINKLKKIKSEGGFSAVMEFDLKDPRVFVFDLTKNNQDLAKIDLNDITAFSKYISDNVNESGCYFGIGKYAEDRTIYSKSSLFNGQAEEEKRTIHLGIDLWAAPGTKVFAPYEGVVHSFKNNKDDGDYGPTIVLRHEFEGVKFHTLYGHLSLDSLDGLHYNNRAIAKGEEIARLGNYPVNGNWPPHLHFQIIKDMKDNVGIDKVGDFFGVTSFKEKDYYLKNSPDPNLILGIEKLGL